MLLLDRSEMFFDGLGGAAAAELCVQVCRHSFVVELDVVAGDGVEKELLVHVGFWGRSASVWTIRGFRHEDLPVQFIGMMYDVSGRCSRRLNELFCSLYELFCLRGL